MVTNRRRYTLTSFTGATLMSSWRLATEHLVIIELDRPRGLTSDHVVLANEKIQFCACVIIPSPFRGEFDEVKIMTPCVLYTFCLEFLEYMPYTEMVFEMG